MQERRKSVQMTARKGWNDGIIVETAVFLFFYAGNVQFFADFHEIQLKCQAVFMDDGPFSGIFALVVGCRKRRINF